MERGSAISKIEEEEEINEKRERSMRKETEPLIFMYNQESIITLNELIDALREISRTYPW